MNVLAQTTGGLIIELRAGKSGGNDTFFALAVSPMAKPGLLPKDFRNEPAILGFTDYEISRYGIWINDVGVRKESRRMGVASAMYEFISEIHGRPILRTHFLSVGGESFRDKFDLCHKDIVRDVRHLLSREAY